MAFDYKYKYKSTRSSNSDNLKLDKIRNTDSEKTDKIKSLFNVWIALIISVSILVLALIIPYVANFRRERFRNDAFKWAKDAVQIIRKTTMDTMGGMVMDRTMFVVKRSNQYYLFWYDTNAVETSNLVEIDDPNGSLMPVNVKKGAELEYPFDTPPIVTTSDNKAELINGLQVLSGYEVVPFNNNESLNSEMISSVQLYLLKVSE